MAASEILCTDVRSIERAAAIGADRIELCAALEVGGVTPGPGLQRAAIALARDSVSGTGREIGREMGRGEAVRPLEVVVLVRPRRGDFVLEGEADLALLQAEILAASEFGASGVAVGVLGEDGEIDVHAMRALLEAAGPMNVTFHRAIDHTPDLEASVATLIELGIGRVLTSGQAATAWRGRAKLASLVERFGRDIEVIAAGGVSGANAASLLEATGVGALHGSCTREVVSHAGASPLTNLGKPGAPSESSRLTLDEASARALVAAARGTGPRVDDGGEREPRKAGFVNQGASYDAVRLEVHETDQLASRAVATEMAELIERQPRAVLGLATGSTMLGVYAELVRLVRERRIDCSSLTTFNLDEYVGVSPSDPNSFRAFMESHLFGPAGFPRDRCRFPEVSADTASDAAPSRAYEAAIREAGGLDLQLLGLGRNGHIAFNEPGSSKDSRTRSIELDSVTRRDAADAFGGLPHVPMRAVTMGVGTILEARRLRVLAFGEHKAEVVVRTLSETPSAAVPSTWIRDHPDVEMHVDRAASRGLAGLSRTN